LFLLFLLVGCSCSIYSTTQQTSCFVSFSILVSPPCSCWLALKGSSSSLWEHWGLREMMVGLAPRRPNVPTYAPVRDETRQDTGKILIRTYGIGTLAWFIFLCSEAHRFVWDRRRTTTTTVCQKLSRKIQEEDAARLVKSNFRLGCELSRYKKKMDLISSASSFLFFLFFFLLLFVLYFPIYGVYL
jgi:hypothetical protein